MDVCNAAARWDMCGGKSLEYYEWQCAYYKAMQSVDYLYRQDGNFTKMSLDSCFEKYLKDLPEFKLAEEYCLKAKNLKTESAFSLSDTLKATSVLTLISFALLLI